jgi:hypothetical protein
VVVGLEGANHVVVVVEPDAVGLLLVQLRGVVERANKAAFLSTPPGETELVLEALVVLDRLGDLEQRSSAASVVTVAV